MGFGDGVKASAERMQKQVNAATLARASELFTTIIGNTPIGISDTKGQLINNWHVGFGKGKYNRNITSSYKTSGINSRNEVSKLKGSVEFLGKDGEVSFTNSVSYAFRAEYAGWPEPKWTGRVMPYGMVRNSLAAIAAKYKK